MLSEELLVSILSILILNRIINDIIENRIEISKHKL